MTADEQRRAAKRFAKTWQDRGYEKGESQKFWLSLLQDVYGVEYPAEYINFEDQVKFMDKTSFLDAIISATHVLIEQKSLGKNLRDGIRQSDGTLLTPFQQAMRYSAGLPYSERPRWIVLSNFSEFHIFDMEKLSGDPEIVYLKDLEKDYYRLNFLVDVKDEFIRKQTEVSLQAGELVGLLYDALLKQYHHPDDPEVLHHLNILCVRIVFCLYAEDAGLFGRKGKFRKHLESYPPISFRQELMRLFRVLNEKPEDRDPYLDESLASFPYVNGGLFEEENIKVPRLDEEIRDIILNRMSADFDWKMISPTIFGAVFESTLNPETRRAGGMHYTSIENIHKVIDPLFMNDLREELETIKSLKLERTRKDRLSAFQEKLASLQFLDPAAGSGNFLTETYTSLRRLENEALRMLYSDRNRMLGERLISADVTTYVQVSIDQFHGIEINDFAVTVARTALWIAESQMLKETEEIVHANLEFLPLTSYANIVEGNALQMDWEDVIPRHKLNYIMGNPPFVGARLMDDEQKKDVAQVFGKLKGVGNLDYVSCWYKLAGDYIQGTRIHCAFVSTNSITQGEQVAILWKPLMEESGVVIDFAYQTFKWMSEASDKAAVHCVIVGFSVIGRPERYLFLSDSMLKKVSHINAYLSEAPSVFIESRKKPLCDVPDIGIGNKPIDGGNYLFTKEEMEQFIKAEPLSAEWFRPWYGSMEFINRKPRYCLWLGDCPPQILRKMPNAMKRIQAVREFRLASKSPGTRRIADRPTRFHVENFPESDYIIIPSVSSERRMYIPMGFMPKEAMSSNLVLVMPRGELFHFGVLTSNVHMAWVSTVGGRLKSDFRYSKDIVYNNFPWPNPTEAQKQRIERSARLILRAREFFPDASLADLYDPLVMPDELRKAHRENDRAVMNAYGFSVKDMSPSDCVAELMKMYQKLISEL